MQHPCSLTTHRLQQKNCKFEVSLSYLENSVSSPNLEKTCFQVFTCFLLYPFIPWPLPRNNLFPHLLYQNEHFHYRSKNNESNEARAETSTPLS